MGQIEIFPEALLWEKAGNRVLVGAPDSLTALSDLSDASYIRANSASGAAQHQYDAQFLLEDPVAAGMPADAIIESVQLKYRYSHTTSTWSGTTRIYEQLQPQTLLVGQMTNLRMKFHAFTLPEPFPQITTSTAIREAVGPRRYQNWQGTPWIGELMTREHERMVIQLTSARSWSLANTARLYNVSVLVNYNERPTVTITEPTGTEIVHRPTVAWTFDDAEDDAQYEAHVRIWTQAQFDSPTFSTERDTLYRWSGFTNRTEHIPNKSVLVDGGQYVVGVAARHKTVGNIAMWQDPLWSFQSFDVDIVEPSPPTVMAQYDSDEAAVVLSVHAGYNLLGWNQAGAEDLDVTGMFTDNALTEVTNTGADFHTGSRSFEITRNTSTGTAAIRTPSGILGKRVVPGQTYMAQAWSKAVTTGRNVGVSISWYDRTGALITTSNGAGVTNATTEWRRSVVIGVAPANAVTASVLVSAINVNVGELHRVDSLGIQMAGPKIYGFHGDAGLWTGTNNTAIAWSDAQADTGAGSMRMTKTVGGGDLRAVPFSTSIPITVGQSVDIKARFRANTTGRNCNITINWLTAAGGANGSVVGSNVADSSAGWVTASVAGVAPASTAFFTVTIEVESGALNEVHYVDNVEFSYFLDEWTRGGMVFGEANHAAEQTLDVERSLDGGETWEFVRGAPIDDFTSQMFDAVDVEVASDRDLIYRARYVGEDENGEDLTSQYSNYANIDVPQFDSYWLRNPVNHEQNMRIRLTSLERERPKPMNVAYSLGHSLATATHDGFKGDILHAEVDLLNKEDHDTFMAMMESGQTLVLHSVYGQEWYVQPGDVRMELLRAVALPSEPYPIRHAHRLRLDFYAVNRPLDVAMSDNHMSHSGM